ncbi:toll/interleukin-1 receptor domain-containing protein [Brevibacillus dissolubilis]|uniref:toll/interleukin-1 receptor domain-containing protein n=1 Tax=Brevibacillus dissolubilis TaxID=1844116 RepID=UPI00159B953E|nr:toll/interleukin-1 receptor domain-containing protein [Brevibacillus dissolubilis]
MSQRIDTILISHAHKDETYVHELVNLIKVTGVERAGVKIVCSSYPGFSIPPDVNIYDYLKGELNGNVWVIYVLSHNYYKSAACLNEMGATWVQNKKYSTFITPNFSFHEIKGAVDPSRNSYRLDDKSKLNDFKRSILQEFNLDLNDNIWESVRDSSLEEISGYAKIEREADRSVRINFESVKNMGSGKIKVALRAINETTAQIEFTYIEIQLNDVDGNELVLKDEPSNLWVFHEENKLIFIEFQCGGSEYSAARHDKANVTFRSQKALPW